AVFGAKTAENLCLGFGCREGKEFCKGLKQKQKPKVPSFPRRRESRPPTRQESIGNNRNRTNLDSRFRGNDGRVVSVVPDKCRHLKSRHSLKNRKPKSET
ncbi:TPA: hypothetical protein ACI6IR_001656, partial [Neisseria meningitidis]